MTEAAVSENEANLTEWNSVLNASLAFAPREGLAEATIAGLSPGIKYRVLVKLADPGKVPQESPFRP